MRTDRKFDETRTVKITDHYLMSPQGSVLIEMGNTKVICTASVEESTAKHLAGTGKGWVTAEYALPIAVLASYCHCILPKKGKRMEDQ